MECAIATHLRIELKQASLYLLHAHDIYQFYDFGSLKITGRFLFPSIKLYNTGKSAYKLQSAIYSNMGDCYLHLLKPYSLLQGKAVISHTILTGFVGSSFVFLIRRIKNE